MLANSSATSRPHRSWLRLQFSLRLLLIAFTGFAIGFPIWYRWPYEETESTATKQRITTWQRQWGGGRLKNGPARQISGGVTIESLVYRNGLRHGPYEASWASGQFVNDLKEGVWTAPDRTSTWHRGKLDGPYELRLPPERPKSPNSTKNTGLSNEPRKIQLVFSEGRLTHFNGQPAASRLFDRMEDESMDQRIRNELDKLTNMDVVEMPLQDCVLYLSEMHGIPIALDPILLQFKELSADMPITDVYQGIDLCSALTLMTAPRGLGCDYRYGSLWITSAADTNDWRDSTGVAQLKPPAHSALARVWNEPVAVSFEEMPLADAIKYFEQRLAVQIDVSRVQSLDNEPAFPVTANLRDLPFRHALGQLLYRTGCRCNLDGDRLVISPPERH
jgi:hypothetical protein